MKRWFILALLIMPSVIAQECLHYSDCLPASCPGAARYCLGQKCAYSECLAGKAKGGMTDGVPSIDEVFGPYSNGFSDAFGTKQILLIGFKVVLLAVVAIGLIALVAIAEIPQGWKTAMIVSFIIVEVALALVLFKGPSFFTQLFFTQEVTWENAIPDYFIPQYMADKNLQKRDIPKNLTELVSKRIELAHEFRASDFDGETRLVVLKLENSSDVSSLRLPEPLKKEERLADIIGETVLAHERSNYTILIWDEDRFVFMLTASPETAVDIAGQIISRYPGNVTESTLFRNDITAPSIRGFFPQNSSLMKERRISFETSDDKSGIRNITVGGVQGFDFIRDCRMEDAVYSCSFRPEQLLQGKNIAVISSIDRYDNVNSTALVFIYDTEGWDILDLMPPDGMMTNSPSISFKIVDNSSGIDEYSIQVTGMNVSSRNVKSIPDGFDCIFIDHSMLSGKKEIAITAKDNSGNERIFVTGFTFDPEKPDIEITGSSFVLRDNMGIDNSSIRVNRKYFDPRSCQVQNNTYNCKDGTITEVSVADLAGNMNTEISRLTR